MTKKHLIITSVFALSLAFFSFAHLAKADFDPNNIISDQEILDQSSMSQTDIQNLLISHNSYLANYTVTNPDGVSMTAAQVIYDRATNNHISPKFIIVLLQKEEGLIEDPNPSQGRLDWAAGYGCPDSGGCNDRWRGLWKQINSASLQFVDYMQNPQLYHYQMGQTYTVMNTNRPDSIVTPGNLATAALYNYTPHVYNGNYNFWTIWQRYFTKSYLNGSLVQAYGEVGVWLLEDGQKHAFLSRTALTSRFDPSHIQMVSRADLDKYETGTPIKFAQYSIVRLPNGTIYLLVDNHKLRFVNLLAFQKMGFNPAEIINAGENELADYVDGAVITTTSTYPTGALLQDKKTGGIFWVNEGIKSPLWDASLLHTKFKNRKIIRTTATELALYPTGEPVTLSDGDIVRTPNSPAVYIIENNLKRPVVSADAFIKLGYKWSNVVTVSEQLLSFNGDGLPVASAQ